MASATKVYGFAKTSEIYEAALEAGMSAGDTLACSLRFARLERKLGEIDRARAIYAHGSQFADPKREKSGFWAEWNEFEVTHGNEDTFREMLRVKRSVQDTFGTTYYAGLAGAGANNPATRPPVEAPAEPATRGTKRPAESSMAMLERLAAAAGGGSADGEDAAPVGGTALSGFVSAGVIGAGDAKAAEGDAEAGEAPTNPDEIDIDVC